MEGFKINILLVAFALGLDAAGVTLAIGCGKATNLIEKYKVIFSFGLFQFLFALIGGLAGNYIDHNFFTISNYFSGTVIFILGILLIREGYKNEEECIYRNLNFWTIVVLSVSVSLDALGAGFSLLFDFEQLIIFQDSLLIGLAASVMTVFSFIIVNYIKHIALVEKYANYIAGIILLIMGFNSLFI